jgi:hypothetical protein
MATESDKVNSGALLTIVVVGTFSMVGVCLGVNALVRHEVNGMSAERAQPAERPVRDLTAEQLGKLNAPPAWSDKAKGLVSLPVERAMEVVVADLARDPNTATPPPPVDAGAEEAAAADVADAGADAEGATDADAAAPDAAPAPNPTDIASSAPTAAAPPAPRPPAPGSVGPAPTPKPVDPKPPAPKPPAPPVAPPTDG